MVKNYLKCITFSSKTFICKKKKKNDLMQLKHTLENNDRHVLISFVHFDKHLIYVQYAIR